MALTDFTTFNDIRATLGVSTDEIEDDTLSLEVYESSLILELTSVDPLVIVEYLNLPSDVSTLNGLQAAFRRAVRLFSTYAVAKQLTISLPLFSPKDISDGKATVGRYSTDPYKEVVKGVIGRYDEYKDVLAAAYSVLYVSTVSAPVTASIGGFRQVSPTYDPVTG